ncbi:MAG: hypothetical protein O3A51_13400 [Verrucomicrobia bacterium]|nr:hypothetical protein [Verrucomicrobiota bacterium]
MNRVSDQANWKHRLKSSLLEIVGLVAIHAVLIRILADHHIVSSLFASGSHVPLLNSLLTAGFILVRLFTVLALPGMILARLGLVWLAWRWPPIGDNCAP